MDFLINAYHFMESPAGAGILAGLFAISEALSLIPAIKANGIFQAIYNGLLKLRKPPTP